MPADIWMPLIHSAQSLLLYGIVLLLYYFLHDAHFVVNRLYLLSTGYPGDSPPSKKLSKSMSVLYHKRSPDFSSTGTLNATGTGLKSGAESMMGKGVKSYRIFFIFCNFADLLTYSVIWLDCIRILTAFKSYSLSDFLKMFEMSLALLRLCFLVRDI